ncbi:hypothetical protein MTsPCn9_34110 [Croceitalea sp. MTPC9]|nr:hypothetical protein MTsPCn6_34840 [Croceitalea sp. MTPC6]GMN18471.1 hypothetical protein MTsPCn9_34110 [Croceitalea sp. MTPC9]
MVEVFRIGAKPKKPNEPLTPEEIGEIVFNTEDEFRLHSSDRVFKKSEYEYKRKI